MSLRFELASTSFKERQISFFIKCLHLCFEWVFWFVKLFAAIVIVSIFDWCLTEHHMPTNWYVGHDTGTEETVQLNPEFTKLVFFC